MEDFLFLGPDDLVEGEPVLLDFLLVLLNSGFDGIQDILPSVELEYVDVFVAGGVKLDVCELLLLDELIDVLVDKFSLQQIVDLDFAFMDGVHAVHDDIYFVEMFRQLHRTAHELETPLVLINYCDILLKFLIGKLVDEEATIELLYLELLQELSQNLLL